MFCRVNTKTYQKKAKSEEKSQTLLGPKKNKRKNRRKPNQTYTSGPTNTPDQKQAQPMAHRPRQGRGGGTPGMAWPCPSFCHLGLVTSCQFHNYSRGWCGGGFGEYSPRTDHSPPIKGGVHLSHTTRYT